MSAITLTDVSVRYGKRLVVDAVDLAVTTGEWLGLIGPNGAGKSSLLRAVAGLLEHSGRIEIDGVDVADMDRARRARTLAYLPQEPLLPDDMTVLEYVLLGRTAHISYFGTATDHDRTVARAALQRLEVAEFADRLLGQMSGGERQRVVLARAIATEAPILLLDEPTTALDIGHQQRALELIDDLRRSEQLTIIAALHDLTLAGSYCERIAIFSGGRVAVCGQPSAVLTAERIGSIYGASVQVETSDRQVVVTPTRPGR